MTTTGTAATKQQTKKNGLSPPENEHAAVADEALREQIKAQSLRLVKRLPALGPVIMLYLQSPHRRYQFISDLEWLLIPPLVSGQCKLYMKQEYPISFVSWAFLTDEVEKRLLGNGGRLRPEDWTSGERLWLIDIVAPFGGVETVLSDMRSSFSEREIHLLAPDPENGGLTHRLLPPLAQTAESTAADGDSEKQ
ncbi:toxin-activating lysine-acyltransferase [Desulfofustis glycolicus]|uniref:RTX toxin-activating lysine-acyltransferase n=1 Tax=Desulfofustis glycolicus DSM 9705 TaxID=1121409 RepID=A0A1M5YPW9_9BACT|nr:toxin-activating lysine-acyltransferase [Desulfofustis glycolicus]MCB2218462.1 toxin-activating lysine-acyltransferase [Desulfobulbaceae bacterium]SHI14066.1 cytolysin-activating lysine-acyltransferase [Desulfofustis glycolicus DSM 9705]